jgi:hypothetical protein
MGISMFERWDSNMPENDQDGSEGHSQLKAEGVGRGGAGAFSSSSRLSWVVCLVQFVLLVVLAFALWRSLGSSSGRPGAPVPYVAGSSEPYFKGNPGPWGQLEYARIRLEPSDEFIPTDERFFGPTRWFFEGYTRPALGEFFDQCGLTAAQLTGLKDPATWQDKPDGIEVMPHDDLVLGLNRPARERIYSVLARSRINILHLWPFKSREGGVDEWFGQSGLSAGTLALLKQLTYSRSGRRELHLDGWKFHIRVERSCWRFDVQARQVIQWLRFNLEYSRRIGKRDNAIPDR